MRRLVVLLAVLGIAGCAMTPATATPPGRKYVVFFQEWSAGLDAPALQTIAAAAAAAAKDTGASVTVTGYADPLGSVQANIFLTETRAQVVIDQLTADGVAPGRIRRVAAGKVPYQLTSQESRRVVISVGGS
jgi:outer membrane protein OmpA-like peptidoglycan-associated protein